MATRFLRKIRFGSRKSQDGRQGLLCSCDGGDVDQFGNKFHGRRRPRMPADTAKSSTRPARFQGAAGRAKYREGDGRTPVGVRGAQLLLVKRSAATMSGAGGIC